jgi:hypothetical protein
MTDMKSKRTKEFIQKHDSRFSAGAVVHAVELAEEDARERAVKALVASCPFCDDGRKHCWRDGRTCDEACVPEFLKHYNNEGN